MPCPIKWDVGNGSAAAAALGRLDDVGALRDAVREVHVLL
jgi:hypothetical protein